MCKNKKIIFFRTFWWFLFTSQNLSQIKKNYIQWIWLLIQFGLFVSLWIKFESNVGIEYWLGYWDWNNSSKLKENKNRIRVNKDPRQPLIQAKHVRDVASKKHAYTIISSAYKPFTPIIPLIQPKPCSFIGPVNIKSVLSDQFILISIRINHAKTIILIITNSNLLIYWLGSWRTIIKS